MDGDHSVAKPCGTGPAAVAPLEIVEQNPAPVLLGDLGKPVVVDLEVRPPVETLVGLFALNIGSLDPSKHDG